MIFIKFLFYFIFTSLLAQATIYEDAEDEKTFRWKLLNADTSTSVNNIDDLEKKSRIIEFRGGGTKYIHELKLHEEKKKQQKDSEHFLSWQMKFSEDFVIIVILNTNIGERYLIYTPGIFKSYMQYGLGYAITNGEWHTFRRNLQEDIAYFDNRVKIISLKSFILKGNGKLDNIMTKKRKLIKQVIKKTPPKTTNFSPSITVLGHEFIQLNLGEAYEDEGAHSYDNEDGEINVVSLENIDTNEAGRYMVLYMATDSHGNMALDKRYVHVGKVEEETEVILNDDEIEKPKVDNGTENNKLSEEEKQIIIWENELVKYEKILLKREKNRNEN